MSLTIIGWLATAVFASSYLFRRPLILRRIQAGAALLWVMYGMAIDAVPVVVANLIVAGAALYSSFAPRRAEGSLDLDEPDDRQPTRIGSSGSPRSTG
jgi:hypothetical protein